MGQFWWILRFYQLFTSWKSLKNLSTEYYQYNKERFQKQTFERYQSLPKEEREKKTVKSLWYKKISEDGLRKLIEYRKKYKIRKNVLL